jgi:hypothetical protein
MMRLHSIKTGVLLFLLLVVWLKTALWLWLPDVVIPGWHETILPLAIRWLIYVIIDVLSFIQILLLLTRLFFRLEHWYTLRRMITLNWLLLFFGGVLGLTNVFSFLIEPFFQGTLRETFLFYKRVFGLGRLLFLVSALAFPLISQLFWVKMIRENLRSTLVICLVMQLGLLFGLYFLY